MVGARIVGVYGKDKIDFGERLLELFDINKVRDTCQSIPDLLRDAGSLIDNFWFGTVRLAMLPVRNQAWADAARYWPGTRICGVTICRRVDRGEEQQDCRSSYRARQPHS
jgi:hypothetical protein